MAGRLFAGSTIAALFARWLVVLATAVHLTLDHGHGDHGLAGRAWAPAPRVAAAMVPVATLPGDTQPERLR